jgi:hypothetical protein
MAVIVTIAALWLNLNITLFSHTFPTPSYLKILYEEQTVELPTYGI